MVVQSCNCHSDGYATLILRKLSDFLNRFFLLHRLDYMRFLYMSDFSRQEIFTALLENIQALSVTGDAKEENPYRLIALEKCLEGETQRCYVLLLELVCSL